MTSRFCSFSKAARRLGLAEHRQMAPLVFFRAFILKLTVAVLAVMTFAACAPVQPWERGRLAQPMMSLQGDALLGAIDEHTYSSKEAASGGIGPAGGGCGCN